MSMLTAVWEIMFDLSFHIKWIAASQRGSKNILSMLKCWIGSCSPEYLMNITVSKCVDSFKGDTDSCIWSKNYEQLLFSIHEGCRRYSQASTLTEFQWSVSDEISYQHNTLRTKLVLTFETLNSSSFADSHFGR